jgi:hypothetical protein
MKTFYIVIEKNELRVYRIRDDQKESFLADYGSNILAEGDSLEDALVRLEGKQFDVGDET